MNLSEQLRLSLVTAPAIEPVTVAEFKQFLRLDSGNYEGAPISLTPTLSGSSGNLSAGAYRYRLTYVTADGETEGGTISSSVTVVDPAVAGKIALSGIPTGGSLVTSRKIYRTEADGSEYKLLTTISDNTTTSYTDNIADASLGAGCPTINTTDDPELIAFIKAARMTVEKLSGLHLITQTWDYWLNQFPCSEIVIPAFPVQSVSSIVYTDSTGTLQTWDSAEYDVIIANKPSYILPKYDYDYPTSNRGHNGDIKIRFISGYSSLASDVPENIKLAIKILANHFYSNRELVSMTGQANNIPFSVNSLLDLDRIHWFGEIGK